MLLFVELTWTLAIHWYRCTSEQDCKGIRALVAIYKHRGKKKFRGKRNSSINNHTTIDLGNSSIEGFKEYIRRNAYQSSYGDFFNKNEASKATKTTREPSILKFQKYSQLPYTKYLTEEMKSFLDRWQSLGDEDQYQKVILCY